MTTAEGSEQEGIHVDRALAVRQACASCFVRATSANAQVPPMERESLLHSSGRWRGLFNVMIRADFQKSLPACRALF